MNEEAIRAAESAYWSIENDPEGARDMRAAISAYLSALPQQEPVGWLFKDFADGWIATSNAGVVEGLRQQGHAATPLFASPISPPSEVDGLTAQEWKDEYLRRHQEAGDNMERALSAEAKLAALQPDRAGSGDAVRVKPKIIKRHTMVELLDAVYKHHGWRRKMGESRAKRVQAIYAITTDAPNNVYIATLTTDADRPDAGKEGE